MSEFVPNISDAIKDLGIDGGFKIIDGKIAKWYSEKEQPSEEQIQAKLAELQADYDTKKYQRDRAVAYPSIADQLDKIYHSGIDAWKADIKAVKDAHPKPE